MNKKGKSFLKASIRNMFVVAMLMVSMLFVVIPLLNDSVSAATTTGYTEYNGQNSKMYTRYAASWTAACAVTSAYAAPDFTAYSIYCTPSTNILQRTFLVYDTSGIPDDATITGVSLSFTTLGAAYTANHVYVQNSNSGNSIEQADFNNASFGSLYCDFNWGGGTSAINMSFDQNISGSVSKTGYTCLVVRFYNDYKRVTPVGDNGFTGNDEDLIKLWVTYTVPVYPPSAPVYFDCWNQYSVYPFSMKLNWTKSSDADKTTIFYLSNSGDYPTKDDVIVYVLYNGSANYCYFNTTSQSTLLTFSAYSWNETNRLYSLVCLHAKDTTLSFLPYINILDLRNCTGSCTVETYYHPFWEWVYAINVTAESQLNISTNLVNVTSSHNALWSSPFWDIVFNASGNTTPIHSFDNIVDATGSHTIIQNSTGYWDWANYTGYSNALHINDTNMTNVTWHLDYNYNTVTGWYVYLNGTGNTTPLQTFSNIVHATGSHVSKLNSTGYWVWANYTGYPLHLFNNSINVTGGLVNVTNATGYWVYANYTGIGNGSNVTVYIPISGHSSLVQPVSITLGMCLVAPLALLVGRRRRHGNGGNES